MSALAVAYLVALAGAEADSVPQRDRDEAAAHARRAEALVAQRRYDEAERELHAAFALDSSPFHLFGLGMVAKLRGDCERASGYFVRTLQSLPASDLGADARASTKEASERELEACGAELPADVSLEAQTPEHVDVRPPAPVVPPAAAATTLVPLPYAVRERPWSRDPAGASLLAVGLAGVAAGGSLLIAGAIVRRDADEFGSARAYLDERERSRRLVLGGVVLTSAAAALVLGAVVRYTLVRRRFTRTRSPMGARNHSR